MSTVSGTGSTTQSNTVQSALKEQSLNELKPDDFLKLMIIELQNQDPLNPMDNDQMLRQLGEIRSIGATTALTSSLEAIMLGQNLGTASNMIDRTVTALGKDGKDVTGKVDKVSVADNVVTLHIGKDEVLLTNVRSIVP